MKNNRFIFLLISWIACVICGCMGGGGAQSNFTASSLDGLTLSVTPTLQLATNNSSLITALLVNNTDKSIDTISFNSNDSHLLVLGNGCSILLPGESCKVNLQLNAGKDNGGYLLQAHGRDDGGQEHETQQLFSYTSVAEEKNNLISQTVAANNRIVSKSGELFALAIPFTKNSLGEEITSSLGGLDDIVSQETVCSDTNKTQCTLIAIGRSSKSESITVKLSANNVVFYTATVNILAASRGNLVSSNSNVTVSPADGESFTSFTLLNNGSESVTGINVFATNHSAIESQISASGCKGTLAVGASCSMNIKVNGNQFNNGELSMSISYNTPFNSGTTSQVISDKISLWLYYLNSAPTPALRLSSESTNFINSLVGYNSTGTFTVTNTGNTALSKINITNPVYISPSFTIDANSPCYKLSTPLLPGKTCQFSMKFNQTRPENGYLPGVQAVANYNESNSQVLSIASNVLSPYYNSSPNFAYFGRWTSSLGGFDFCTFDNNGSVSNCVRRESTNTFFASGEKPETIQPMIMPDGTFLTYMVDNNNGKIYQCKTNLVDGTFTDGCKLFYDLPTIYGLHIYKHGMWNGASMKYYLYVGGQQYGGTDQYIGVCPITESGTLVAGGNCSLDSSDGDTSSLMFDESKIYEMSYNSAKVCNLDPNTGKTSGTCTSLGGDIKNYYTGSYFNSLVTVVTKDQNGLNARYAYLSDMGGDGGDTTGGRIIRCTLAKNLVSNNLDFNDCSALITGMKGLRGLEVISVESKNYLYYTNNQLNTNALFSREILPGGLLGSEVTQPAVFPSATGSLKYVNDQMYVLRIPGTYFKYDKNIYTVTKGNSFTMQISFTGTSTIGNSRVFYGNSLIPNSITFNGASVSNFFADFAVESGFDVKTVTVNVSSSVAVGSYTLSGITSNGVKVPNVTIRVI